MGNEITRVKLLDKEEIDKISSQNQTLEKLFNRFKNINGYLRQSDLEIIFDRQLDQEIVKKLYKICASQKNKFNYDDLKYLYTLFVSNSFEIKILFIASLLFKANGTRAPGEYKKKCDLFFKNCDSLRSKFLSDEIVSKLFVESSPTKMTIRKNTEDVKDKTLQRDQFINFCKGSLTEDDLKVFNNFSNNERDNLASPDKNTIYIRSRVPAANCLCNNIFANENIINLVRRLSSQSKTLLPVVLDKKYSGMEAEFIKIEKMNNGIFIIDILENLFKEIDLNEKLISYVLTYIKKKTQKNFIDFKNFKSIIARISDTTEEMIYFLHEMVSYPKDTISVNQMITLIRSFKLNISSSEIGKMLEGHNIIKERIDNNLFKEIILEHCTFILDSVERIKYLPYIKFKVLPDDKKTEKNIIEILFKGQKDIRVYIDEIIEKENIFYVLDINFWKKWCESVQWKSSEENKVVLNTNQQINTESSNDGNPCINLQSITEFPGKLKPGLVYLKDYVVLPFKIYDLFTIWYPNSQLYIYEMKRMRIEYPELNEYDYKFSSDIKKLIRQKYYEVETYPIFIRFFLFDEIVKDVSDLSMTGIKQFLSKLDHSKSNSSTNVNSLKNGSSKLIPYSRTTKFKEIQFDILNHYKQINVKSRLWVYFGGELIQSNPEKTLESEVISDVGIVILELNINGSWISEDLEQEAINKLTHNFKDESRNLLGIVNIGNSKAINEFLGLLKKKWKEEDCKTIVPRQWKEVIGNINEQFKAYDQQDAGDYMNFIIDVLHEEINLKSTKEYIQNPEFYNGEQIELGSEYWANNLRRNLSFIHSLFLGQLQSRLVCQTCGNNKISYEPFLTLSLPIPQKKTIFLEIILHRLPFTFKAYYYRDEDKRVNDKLNRRLQLNEVRKQSINEASVDIDQFLTGKLEDEKQRNLVNGQRKLSPVIAKDAKDFNSLRRDSTSKSQLDFKGNKDSKKNLADLTNSQGSNVLSRLTCSIPLRLLVEFDRTKKVDSIIQYITQEMKSLELEKEIKYTRFFIGTSFNGMINFIVDKNLTIDDCFQNHQVIHIYEVLNTIGLNKLFKYGNEQEIVSHVNPKNIITLYNNPVMFNSIRPGAPDIIEFLVSIHHRYPVKLDEYLFKTVGYSKLDTGNGFLIFSNKNTIKPRDLYDFMWDKYHYFLNSPTKIEKLLWWTQSDENIEPDLNKSHSEIGLFSNRNNLKNTIKNCYPFVLKCLNKDDHSCPKCPWFKFCNGCVIDPFSSQFVEMKPSYALVVEWCSDMFNLKEITEQNLKLVLNHESVQGKEEDLTSKSIQECINLFTEKEVLDDRIYCSTCKKQTKFYKKLDFERLPPVLITVLKRFKYTQMYKCKIDNLINFPIQDLSVDSMKSPNSSYDLYGIINHTGSLYGGHYTSIVKHGNKWIKYDDSRCYEVDENQIKTNQAYILVYKLRGDTQTSYSNLMNYTVYNEIPIVNDNNNLSQSLKRRRSNGSYSNNNMNSNTLMSTNRSFLATLSEINNPIRKQLINQTRVTINTYYNETQIMTNPFVSLGESSLNRGSIVRFFPEEPVKTKYGKGFVINEFIENNIRFVKIKYRYGYGVVKLTNVEKESILTKTIPPKEEPVVTPQPIQPVKKEQTKGIFADCGDPKHIFGQLSCNL